VDIRQLVADKLNALGYERELNDGRLIPVEKGLIQITDVEYSTICAES